MFLLLFPHQLLMKFPKYTTTRLIPTPTQSKKKPEIEWVRLKDGRIGNVLQRNGNWLVVRESGMRSSFKVNLLDCEYIHYKGENAPLLESKN